MDRPFTYTIKYPYGRIEHHSGTVRKESPACPRKDIEEGEAKFEAAALVPRRESQFEMAAATWFSSSPESIFSSGRSRARLIGLRWPSLNSWSNVSSICAARQSAQALQPVASGKNSAPH